MVRLNLLSRWPRPSSGRQGKAKVTPTSQYLQHETPLQNVNTEDINKQIKTRQQKQAHYYNREARDLPPLQEGDEHCTHETIHIEWEDMGQGNGGTKTA